MTTGFLFMLSFSPEPAGVSELLDRQADLFLALFEPCLRAYTWETNKREGRRRKSKRVLKSVIDSAAHSPLFDCFVDF